MSNIKQCFKPLSESQRAEYLQAMQVPVWVLRNQEVTDEILDAELVLEEQQNLEEQQSSENNQRSEKKQYSEKQPNLEAPSIEAPDNSPLKTASQSNRNKHRFLADKPNFIKMVNWKKVSGASKHLLILCRHHKDQPAQSFASPNGPSLFMQDYLLALDEYLTGDDVLVQVSLAHLTETNLANICKPMSEKVEQLKPDIIFLLGEEGIEHLFDSSSSIATLRGQLHQINDYNLMVSYHPYDLIKNAKLKKLALDDLNFLSKALKG